MTYVILNYVLSDNCPQFVEKYFESVCGYLEVNQKMKTKYHPQANGKNER